ncbi:MAG: 3-methyl-2-oxobutanoate hydroxymethyltransferase [Coxiella sp. (in: Bacteria)]|nr:MAG: 3-methyl-2-oxobutanoate hydroxymethyltransferase [Coxiella sp. (in: g-proteobacteria)]
MTVPKFQKMKRLQEKITMITCYDHPSACIIDETAIDLILVGDSVAMVVHGYPDTTHATVDMIALHTSASRRGTSKFIVADMPFMSYRKSRENTLDNAHKLIMAGANAVKLESALGNLDVITQMVESGIPVVGHLGLTPQHINTLGGFKVQGRDANAQAELIEQAKQLEAAGCFMLVLECVPAHLANSVTEQLNIPTIGIGAGPQTDGQVLVWHDLLGMQQHLKLKFLKKYMNGFSLCKQAIDDYNNDVKQVAFPDIQQHCF